MLNIGLPEIIVILIVALLVVGPDKLPDLARSLGKTLSELKQSVEELKESFNKEEGAKILDDIKPELEDIAQTVQETLKDLPPNSDPKEFLKKHVTPIIEHDQQPESKSTAVSTTSEDKKSKKETPENGE